MSRRNNRNRARPMSPLARLAYRCGNRVGGWKNALYLRLYDTPVPQRWLPAVKVARFAVPVLGWMLVISFAIMKVLLVTAVELMLANPYLNIKVPNPYRWY